MTKLTSNEKSLAFKSLQLISVKGGLIKNRTKAGLSGERGFSIAEVIGLI